MPKLPSLVPPHVLEPLLDDPDVVVLDTTWSTSFEGPKSPRAQFEASHLPGARFFDFRATRQPGSALHDTLCTADQFQDYARSLGISDQHVVCYSQGLFSGAARGWWLFRVFGHNEVSVLHGGLAAWREGGHAIERGAHPACAPGVFEAKLHERRLCGLDQVERSRDGGAQIVDARPTAVFTGEQDWFAERNSPATGRPGHIGGSRNLPSASLVEGGRLKPLEQLAEVVAGAGIDASRPTVTTCSLGVGASGTAFVLHLLGNDDVAVFDGSWEAWAASGRPRSRGEPEPLG